MKSAYQVLGVPGNADAQDIEVAFEAARRHHSPAYLAATDGAVDRFNEIQQAWRVLKDPESRAAHDRKLAAAKSAPVRPRIAPAAAQPASGYAGLLKLGVAVVMMLFGAGFYLSYQNAQARERQTALELAMRQQQERETEAARLAAERVRLDRDAAQRQSEADERRLVQEGKALTERAAADSRRTEAIVAQQQRAAQYETSRREAAQAAERQRSEFDARRRLAADRQRIRELCWQNYRKVDC